MCRAKEKAYKHSIFWAQIYSGLYNIGSTHNIMLKTFVECMIIASVVGPARIQGGLTVADGRDTSLVQTKFSINTPPIFRVMCCL